MAPQTRFQLDMDPKPRGIYNEQKIKRLLADIEIPEKNGRKK